MKYHDNVVKLNLKKGELYEIDGKFGYFKVTELCITSGQDPDKKNKVGNVYPINANGEIVFRVGRKGSSEVANWWKERIPANHTTFNHDPGDLNFAFIGELVLYVASIKKVVTYKNVGLAQGHAGASNNWWFGGKEMRYIGNHKVFGKDIDGMTNFIGLRGDNNVNEVNLQIYVAWMLQLSDETFVSELSIPGTHDSGTSGLKKTN